MRKLKYVPYRKNWYIPCTFENILSSFLKFEEVKNFHFIKILKY